MRNQLDSEWPSVPYSTLNRIWHSICEEWNACNQLGLSGTDIYSFRETTGTVESSFTSNLCARGESYNPLEIKHLWRDFLMSQDYSNKAHFLFQKYGFLYGNAESEMYDIQDELNDKEERLFVEPIEVWYTVFDHLNLAKELWSIIRSGDFIEDDNSATIKNKTTLAFEEYPRSEASMRMQGFYPSDSLSECRRQLEFLVTNGIGPITMSVSISLNSTVKANFVPPNLSSAVWIQFFELISEEDKILNCNFCQQPFVRSRGQHRDKIFCSNACKQKAWRNSPEQIERRQKHDQL